MSYKFSRVEIVSTFRLMWQVLSVYFCLWYPDSFLGRDEQFSDWTEPLDLAGAILSPGMSQCLKFTDEVLSHDSVMEK